MEAAAKISYSRCVIDAIAFTFKNAKMLFIYFFPFGVISAICYRLEDYFGGEFQFLFIAIDIMASSIFAIQWHRFSAKPNQQLKFIDFIQLGKLHFKYILLSLIYFFPIIYVDIVACPDDQICMETLVSMALEFVGGILLLLVFPAVALSQPVKIWTLFHTTMRSILTIMIGWLFQFVILTGPIIALAFAIGALEISEQVSPILDYAIFPFVFGPFINALFVTSMTFFYVRKFGLVEKEPD